MYLFLVIAILCTCIHVHADNNSEAIAECGNLHHLEFHNLPNAEAQFSNDNCMLKCTVESKTLSTDNMNEGFACPKNPNGICHNGQCVLTPHPNNDALRECGNIHHIDFLHQNSTGTIYSDSQCSLKCVIKGSAISVNSINEGFPCPENHNGICRQGQCVLQTLSTSKPIPVTTQTPTTPVAHSLFKIHEFEMKIYSARVSNITLGLYASAHIEELDPHTHIFHSKSQICATARVTTHTNVPYWNSSCHYNDQHNFETAYITIFLYDEHNFLGSFKQNVYQIFSNYFRPGSKRISLDNSFPILDGTNHIGQFHLIFNATLD